MLERPITHIEGGPGGVWPRGLYINDPHTIFLAKFSGLCRSPAIAVQGASFAGTVDLFRWLMIWVGADLRGLGAKLERLCGRPVSGY